ncbi:hypothetical protein SRB17_84970 [Streptomyces sp. RB17]|nr:hypothetical protein [Streptomyces sp. RB17]
MSDSRPHGNVTRLKKQLGNELLRWSDKRADGLRARKKERTRDAIGDAAVSLLLERGFDRVSVNDIAAAAEISKPTLFRYFPTKEDLVRGLRLRLGRGGRARPRPGQ